MRVCVCAEEYGPSMVVEGRKLGEYTVWHYTIFAIAGAIFILGIVVSTDLSLVTFE